MKLESGPPLRIYTPESPIRKPREFLAQSIGDVRSARVLAWRLFIRDIAALYRQTALGYFGALLPPVATTLIWVLLNSSRYVNIKTAGIPYPVFVLTGTLFWQLFVDALNAPLKQLSSNRNMLNRVNFPTEALFISGIGQVLFSFLIKLAVLAAVLLAFRTHVEWTAILLIFPIMSLLAIGTVIGMFLAPVGLLYRDIEQALPTIITPLMFLTPVVYPASAGKIGEVMRLNPLTPSFNITRELLYSQPGSTLASFALVWAGTMVIAVVAWLLYRLSLPILVERFEA